jgi:hypothetical protein
MGRELLFFAVIIISVSAGFSPAWSSSSCSSQKGETAERSIADIKTWEQLHASFSLYAPCDDGAIAEGYSDKIANLLVDQWGSINDLSGLSDKDPGFRQFVLNHVNELMTPDQAKSISRLATDSCPIKSKPLCAKLIKKVAHFGQ